MFAIAQPLVSYLFIRGDSPPNFWRIVLGHQNGMTAILLTITIELQTGQTQLMSVTIPAVLFIALFYSASNWYLDILWLPDEPASKSTQSLISYTEKLQINPQNSLYSVNKEAQELNAIINDIKSTAHQIGQYVSSIVKCKHRLKARCMALDEEIERINSAKLSLAKGYEDKARELTAQKTIKEQKKVALERKLDNHQQFINISLQDLRKLKVPLSELEKQIRKSKQSVVLQSPTYHSLKINLDGAHSLLMDVINLEYSKSIIPPPASIDRQSNTEPYTFRENTRLTRSFTMSYKLDITTQLKGIETRLQRYKRLHG